jgi:hypothetical protein
MLETPPVHANLSLDPPIHDLEMAFSSLKTSPPGLGLGLGLGLELGLGLPLTLSDKQQTSFMGGMMPFRAPAPRAAVYGTPGPSSSTSWSTGKGKGRATVQSVPSTPVVKTVKVNGDVPWLYLD